MERESDPPLDVCYLDCTFDTDQWEADLKYLTVLVQVVGTRPPVEPEDAKRAISEQFQLEENALEIHKVAPPEDFLLRGTLPWRPDTTTAG